MQSSQSSFMLLLGEIFQSSVDHMLIQCQNSLILSHKDGWKCCGSSITSFRLELGTQYLNRFPFTGRNIHSNNLFPFFVRMNAEFSVFPYIYYLVTRCSRTWIAASYY